MWINDDDDDEWFKVNGLSLNIEKTSVIHLKSHHLQDNPFQISYQGKEIKEVTNTKFLGLSLDQHMEWKIHINLMISKLSSACYIIRSMHSFSDITALKNDILWILPFHNGIWNHIVGEFIRK